MARFRVGPIRFGGGRKVSATLGVGPLGMTVGGGRKRQVSRSGAGHSVHDSPTGRISAAEEEEGRLIAYRRQCIQRLIDQTSDLYPGSSVRLSHDNNAVGVSLGVGLALTVTLFVLGFFIGHTAAQVAVPLLGLAFLLADTAPGTIIAQWQYQRPKLRDGATHEELTAWFEKWSSDYRVLEVNEARQFRRHLRLGLLPIASVVVLLDVSDWLAGGATEFIKTGQAAVYLVLFFPLAGLLVARKTWRTVRSKNLVIEELLLVLSSLFMTSSPKWSLVFYEQLKTDREFLKTYISKHSEIESSDTEFRQSKALAGTDSDELRIRSITRSEVMTPELGLKKIEQRIDEFLKRAQRSTRSSALLKMSENGYQLR